MRSGWCWWFEGINRTSTEVFIAKTRSLTFATSSKASYRNSSRTILRYQKGYYCYQHTIWGRLGLWWIWEPTIKPHSGHSGSLSGSDTWEAQIFSDIDRAEAEQMESWDRKQSRQDLEGVKRGRSKLGSVIQMWWKLKPTKTDQQTRTDFEKTFLLDPRSGALPVYKGIQNRRSRRFCRMSKKGPKLVRHMHTCSSQ